ncbi:MAG: exo-alpha-sialidase [Anaerolineae bacterium]|nr:exo-alpha-sialidase [Anaerolineae bacterium]
MPAQPVDPTGNLSHARNAFLLAGLTDHSASPYLHLVWEQDGRVRYARRDGIGWQVEGYFAPTGDSPTIAVGPDGRLHLVYVDISTDSAQLQVHYCVRNAQGWGLPRLVDGGCSLSDHPTIAVVGEQVHVVWTERLDARNQLVHARSTNDGQLWDSVRPIPDAWGYAPVLAVGPDSTLWLAWQSEPEAPTGQASDIYVSRWNGVFWSAPENVSRTPTTDSRAPDLVATAPDEAHIAWEEESADGSPGVYHSARGILGWGAPILLSQDEGRQPSIARTIDAGVYVAWDAGQSVHLRSRSAAGNWDVPLSVASVAGGVRDVALAADREGRPWAVWSAMTEAGVWSLFFSSRVPVATATPTLSVTATSTASLVASVTASAPSTRTVPTWTPTPLSGTPSASATSRVHVPVVLKWGNVGPETSPSFQRRSGASDGPAQGSLRAALSNWAWETAYRVSQTSETAREPVLARRENGQVFVVWVERYGGYDMLYYSIRSGETWSTPTSIYGGEEPSLAIGPDDAVHLAYACEFMGNYDIFYSCRTEDGWSPSVNISSTSGNSAQPSLIVKPGGTVVVVWTDTSEGDNRIYYAWRTGSMWNSYIIDGSIDGSAPDLGIGQDGELWAVWQAPESPQQHHVYAISGNGITWGEMAFDISERDDVDSIAPRVVGSTGVGAFIVWQEVGGDDSDIYYAENMDSPYWSPPENVSQTSTRSEQPAATLDQLGRLYIAWSEDQALSITCRDSADSPWLRVEKLTNGDNGFDEVAMVSDPTHHIHLAWSEPRGAAERDIYYRRGIRLSEARLWLALAGSNWSASGR